MRKRLIFRQANGEKLVLLNTIKTCTRENKILNNKKVIFLAAQNKFNTII